MTLLHVITCYYTVLFSCGTENDIPLHVSDHFVSQVWNTLAGRQNGIRIIFANVIINLFFYNMNFTLMLHVKNWVADPLQIKFLEFIYQGEFTAH